MNDTTVHHKEVGGISNYYGGLHIMQKGNKFYWLIEDHSTNFDNMDCWAEISEDLFTALEKEHLTPFKP
jgi:hypothetical protein